MVVVRKLEGRRYGDSKNFLLLASSSLIDIAVFGFIFRGRILGYDS